MNKYEEALACAEFYLEDAKRRITYDKGKVLGTAEIAQKNIEVIDDSLMALRELYLLHGELVKYADDLFAEIKELREELEVKDEQLQRSQELARRVTKKS